MHRVRPSLSIALVTALLGLTSLGASVSGADTGISPSTHPSVGSWMIRAEHDGASTPLGLAKFSADGTAHISGGTVGVGAWEPTGPTAAKVVFVQSEYPSAGLVTFHADIDISDDGQVLSGTYAVSAPSPIVGDVIGSFQDLVLAGLNGERFDTMGPLPVTGQDVECGRTQRFC